jgi:hypothetical protein
MVTVTLLVWVWYWFLTSLVHSTPLALEKGERGHQLCSEYRSHSTAGVSIGTRENEWEAADLHQLVDLALDRIHCRLLLLTMLKQILLVTSKLFSERFKSTMGGVNR